MNNALTIIRSISSLGLRATVKHHGITPRLLGPTTIFTFGPTWQSVQYCHYSSGTRWRPTRTHRTTMVFCSMKTTLYVWKELGKTWFGISATRWREAIPPEPAASFPPSNGDRNEMIKRQEREAQLAGFRDLSAKQIYDILGPTISTKHGNELFRALQIQRTTGTLDEQITTPGSNIILVAKALSWLRANYAVDEDEAIIRRIEVEEEEAEAKLNAPYHPQQNVDQTGLYGKSGLESIRQHYESQSANKSQAEEITEMSKDISLVHKPVGRAVLARRSESAEWVKRYKERALLSKLAEPPVMSRTARLLPSTIFCITIISLCILFAQNYTPPPRKARLFPEMPPAAATVIGIIVMNAAVVVLWRVPPMWRYLNQYFLIIPAMPKAFTMLGNIFSHQGPAHAFGNMTVLWFVGTRLHDDIGRGNFLSVYLSSGVFASIFSLSRFVITNNLFTTSLGASGALTGVLACWCTIHSGEHFTFRFLPSELSPVLSSGLVFAALVSIEVFGILRGYKRIDHVAHLGGYISGFLGAQVIKARARQRVEAEKERKRDISLSGKIREAV